MKKECTFTMSENLALTGGVSKNGTGSNSCRRAGGTGCGPKKAEAAQKAKEIAAKADREGTAAVKEAAERAAAELWTLAKSAEEKSAAESEKIREAAREEMDSLRSHAEDRLEEAADRIVERIVNG